MKIKRIITGILVATLLLSSSMVYRVDAKVIKKTGNYITWLTKKPVDDTIDTPYAKKMSIKSDRIKIYGRINYQPLTGWNPDILKPKKRTFIFSKNCKFYKGWKGDKSKKISKKTWKKLSKRIDKGKQAKRMITWDVKNGTIVKMWYKSY